MSDVPRANQGADTLAVAGSLSVAKERQADDPRFVRGETSHKELLRLVDSQTLDGDVAYLTYERVPIL